MYENMCMRAVNQSVGVYLCALLLQCWRVETASGRAIRHKGDWAALIFVDARYSSTPVRAKLPGWISADLAVHDSYGSAGGQLVKFYNGKKGKSAI